MSTKIQDIAPLVSSTKNYFQSGITKSIGWRISQLKGITLFMEKERNSIIDCLKKDLGQTTFLAEMGEINHVEQAVSFSLKNIKGWMKPKKIKNVPLIVYPAAMYTLKEPLGVCVIFGVWNFPFITVLKPLIAAISAGNCAILKPSEVSSFSAEFLRETLPKYLDEKAIKIVLGGPEQAKELLKQRVDHILYTGNDKIARSVMAEAAKNLTPLTLELGGKNPVVICPSANLKLAAKRVLWGKILNMGQACVAPDFVLVPKNLIGDFCQMCARTLKEFFGDDLRKWKDNKDLSRIINKRHFQRISNLLHKEKGRIVIGGDYFEKELFIQPTVLETNLNSPFMREEIFGPVLPVIATESYKDSIETVNKMEKPLALYVFGKDKKETEKVLRDTSSGSSAVNDTLLQSSLQALPFGGVGLSGFGKINGKWGFDTYSNEKAVLDGSVFIDPPQRYPPFTTGNIKLAKFLSKIDSGHVLKVCLAFSVAMIGVVFAVIKNKM